jgi:signal transduction histidine kinase/ActR/RegA family two-component response regulator
MGTAAALDAPGRQPRESVRDTVRRRQSQALFRLGVMLAMLVFFSRYGHLGPMLWAAGTYFAVQAWENLGLERLYDLAGARVADAAALATFGLSSIAFGIPACLWGAYGGPLGLVCAAYLISGAMLNSVLMTRGCRPAFLVSTLPFFAFLAITTCLAGGPAREMPVVGTLGAAAAAMCVSGVRLWVDTTRIRRSELAALDSLRRREAELARALEAAEAANRAKSEFLANMSHEIRTPLNGVVAMADLLARSTLPAKEREMAQIIRGSGDTLQRLLSDILDVARIESGKLAIEAAPFHVGDMVRSVAALSQLSCDEKGVRLVVEVGPELDRAVMGDQVRVRQVMTNLLSNAVKFTAAGEVRLSVQRIENGVARFTVADTGVGFDMASKAKVLGRFEQADSSITRRFGGSGLGLSICCDLTALMGGTLDCESAPGAGSRFWIELPLEPSAEPAAPEVEAAAPQAEGPPLRILLADDHPTNRRVVGLMLDGGVADLTCVEDGRQALELFRRHPFDLILMDMQMPVMDGPSAICEIRSLELSCGLRRTPVVMLTANALPEHVKLVMDAGTDLHLAKPFTAPALFEVIAAALALPGAQDNEADEDVAA